MYSLVFQIVLDSASKLVALIVYKFVGIMAPSFICPNNNHYHQHGMDIQIVRPYKEKDLTLISSLIVKNP
jgi:hypothetical protein